MNTAIDNGIFIGMTMAFIRNGYTDFYHFGTNYKNTFMTNYYILNTDLVLRFCQYFNEKAHGLIEQSKKKSHLLFLPLGETTHGSECADINTGFSKFIEETCIKKFYFRINDREIYLTRKEMLCIKQLSMGKTFPEIANSLFMSARTVESHIENAKIKMNVKTRSELVAMILNTGFDFKLLIDKR